ncbi:MAG: hypothetical protein Q9196_000413 [Gyalolechia fulgens]
MAKGILTIPLDSWSITELSSAASTMAPTITSRFTTSSAFQCYQALPSCKDFVLYVQQNICPSTDTRCFERANRLQQADYLDIDYDAISRSLILTSFYHKPPELDGWDENINTHRNSSNTEVGLLSSERAIAPEELSVGGFLIVIGEDHKPTPACGLHTYLPLPSPLFVDKYQLSSTNFLAARNLRIIRALSGETDLEAPNWVIRKWGSAVLVEITPPTADRKGSSQGRDKPWHADIPLHLRYLSPTVGGTSDIEVPWPIVFWACPAEEGTKMNVNPFDRVNLGYESLFGPRTMFYHLQPQPAVEGGRLMEKVHVPVMYLQGTRWVESATAAVVAIGAVWVFRKLSTILLRDWSSGEREAPQRKTQ